MKPYTRKIITFTLIYVAIPLCWSSTFLGTQWGLQSFTPLWLGAGRYIGASLLYMAALLAITPLWAVRRDTLRIWPHLLLIGLSGVFLAIVFQNIGMQHTTSSHAALLSVAEPVLVALFAMLFLRERLNRAGWIGLVTAMIGVLLIVTEGRMPTPDAWQGAMKGNLLIMGSLTAYAAYTIFSKQALRHVPPLTVVAVSSLIGTLLLTIFAVILEPLPPLRTIHPIGWLSMVYLIIFPTCLTYFLYNWLLQHVPATRLTVVLFLIPVYGILLGALIMGDRPPSMVYTGGAIAIAGALVLDRTMTNANNAPSG